MPQVVINLTDDQRTSLVTAICANHAYQAEVWDQESNSLVPNPVTPGQFAQQKLVDWGTDQVRSFESRIAHAEAETEVQTTVQALVEGVSVETVEDLE